MQSHDIGQLPDSTGKLIYLVGAEPVVLSGWYDPNQLWFSFMQGAIWMGRDPNYVPAPFGSRGAKRNTVSPRKLERKTYAHMPNEWPHFYRKPYLYEKGVPQYVLPFAEFKRVSNTGLKDLQAAGYPTWERDGITNRPYKVFINDKPYDPATWCEENFDGRFHCNAREITCQFEIDALRAKLVFG